MDITCNCWGECSAPHDERAESEWGSYPVDVTPEKIGRYIGCLRETQDMSEVVRVCN
jgi:hypothetical protein